MSGILDRIKGKKPQSLLERLKEQYPVENVELLGLSLVVPLKRFPKEYEEKLKEDGLKIRYQGYRGETCAFIQLPSSPNQATDKEESQRKQNQVSSVIEESSIPLQQPEIDSSKLSPLKQSLPHFWTSEEETILKTLYSQGVPAKQIAEKLGLSAFQIGAKIRHMPMLERKRGRKPKSVEKSEEGKPKNEDPDVLKELLEAALLLCDSDKKKACMIILSEANRLLKQRS